MQALRKVGRAIDSFTHHGPINGNLSLTVMEGRNLNEENSGTGKMTPFCVIKIGMQKKKTQGHKGSNPQWNEKLDFDIRGGNENMLVKFLVKDEDVHMHDKVGRTEIPLSQLAKSDGQWIQLINATQQKCGEIRIGVEFTGVGWSIPPSSGQQEVVGGQQNIRGHYIGGMQNIRGHNTPGVPAQQGDAGHEDPAPASPSAPQGIHNDPYLASPSARRKSDYSTPPHSSRGIQQQHQMNDQSVPRRLESLRNGGILSIRVLEGRDIYDKDVVSKSDPYCEVTIGSFTKKTFTDKEGGACPEWNDKLTFDIKGSDEKFVCFCVKDKDILIDDKVGKAEIPLTELIQTDDRWINLTNKKGIQAGAIRIRVQVGESSLQQGGQSLPQQGGQSLPQQSIDQKAFQQDPYIASQCGTQGAGSADPSLSSAQEAGGVGAGAAALSGIQPQRQQTDQLCPRRLQQLKSGGLLTIRVLEGRDLYEKKDLLGKKSDPFCQVTVGSMKKKTLTDKEGGATPSWNDSLTFDLRRSDEKLVRFCVKDKDTLIDDKLGGAEIPLNELVQYDDRWITLTNKKGTECGAIRVRVSVGDGSLQQEDEPQQQQSLPSDQKAFQQDPYIASQCGVQGPGSVDPSLSGGPQQGGQPLQQGGQPLHQGVGQTGQQAGVLPSDQQEGLQQQQSDHQSIAQKLENLRNGELLTIRLIEGRDLYEKKDLLGKKSDPYCQVKIGKKLKKKGVVDKEGGATPYWNDKLTFDLKGSDDQVVNFCVKDEDLLIDENIGSAEVPLSELVNYDDQWINLTNKKGRPCGSIRIRVQVGDRSLQQAGQTLHSRQQPLIEDTRHNEINQPLHSQKLDDTRHGQPVHGQKVRETRDEDRREPVHGQKLQQDTRDEDIRQQRVHGENLQQDTRQQDIRLPLHGHTAQHDIRQPLYGQAFQQDTRQDTRQPIRGTEQQFQQGTGQQGMGQTFQQGTGQPFRQGTGQQGMRQTSQQGTGQHDMGQTFQQGMGQPFQQGTGQQGMGQTSQGIGQQGMGQTFQQGQPFQQSQGQPFQQSQGQPVSGQTQRPVRGQAQQPYTDY